VFFQTIVPEEDAVPAGVIAIQTFGDFLGFNPHCHVLCTDGGFYGKGMFRMAPWFTLSDLEKLFRYKVFKINAPFQEEDHGRSGRYDDGLAAFRV
jgi:hypothetical protein